MPRLAAVTRCTTEMAWAMPVTAYPEEKEIPPFQGVSLKAVSRFTMAVALSCLFAFLLGRTEVPAEASTNAPQELVMLNGLRTATYDVKDVTAAKAWYSKVLGIEPYFDQPYYVGFNVGGYELGIVPETNAQPKRTPAGIAYWAVDDARAAHARLLDLGATPHVPIQDVGEGILIGSVHDPFGNVLGVIQNPHFHAK